VTKHNFIYISDNLIAVVSWRQAWELWLEHRKKNEDDFILSAMEAETHLGKFYFAKCSVYLDEREIVSFEQKDVDLL